MTPSKALQLTDIAMRAAERVSASALDDMKNRNGHGKADPLKIMAAAQRSFESASILQGMAEVERGRLDYAASLMDTYLNCNDEPAVSIEEALAMTMHDGSIEEAIEQLLDMDGPKTGRQICAALHDRFSQRRTEDALTNLRKTKSIIGAALPGKSPVWACTERGLELDEIPGYKEASDKIALIRALYSQNLRRAEVAEKVGVTVEEINRWKYKPNIAVIWY